MKINLRPFKLYLASHAAFLGELVFQPSPQTVGRDEKRAPLKTPAWEAKLYGVYLEPLNSSYVGDFSGSWILKGFIHVQTEKGKFVVVCPSPP